MVGHRKGFMQITLFFFFKQKTAYEMRISDWSADVCSSDLVVASSSDPYRQQRQQGQQSQADQDFRTEHGPQRQMLALAQGGLQAIAEIGEGESARQDAERGGGHEAAKRPDDHRRRDVRSEEHKSELQSLMRISYAVF